MVKYLGRCKVGGIEVTSTYGEKQNLATYNVGDLIQYKGIDFYVLKDNGSSITLLKAMPLTTDELVTYSDNHIVYDKWHSTP